MEARSTQRMMVVLIVLLLGAAIFGLVRWIGFTQALGDNPWQNYKADLLARAHADLVNARNQWNSHRVAHYRLTIERAGPGPDPASLPRCQQDLEIQRETVVTTYQDDCSTGSPDGWRPMSPGWLRPDPPFEATVTQLFATVERDTNQIYWTAQGVGCEFVTLEARYDDQIGYPTQLTYRVQPPPRQMGFPIQSEYFNPGEPTPGPGCQTIAVVDGPTLTIHLTPMG